MTGCVHLAVLDPSTSTTSVRTSPVITAVAEADAVGMEEGNTTLQRLTMARTPTGPWFVQVGTSLSAYGYANLPGALTWRLAILVKKEVF